MKFKDLNEELKYYVDKAQEAYSKNDNDEYIRNLLIATMIRIKINQDNGK